jgi:penicillin-binding protein 2
MVDMIGSLKYSCDIFYYNIGAKINMDLIQDMAYRFGFGSPTGIELPGEKAGQVPGRTWKKNYRSEAWYTGDTIAATIGQGHTLATPMQLAVYAARIANGGLAVVPRIVRGDDDAPRFPEIDVSPDHLKLIQRGMFDVVNKPEGTGKYALIERPGHEMCGKTGTSQVRQFTAEEKKYGIDQTLWPWETRSHALFIGYAPYRNPRYAVSVVIEHGIAGGANAGPIARDLILRAMELGGV